MKRTNKKKNESVQARVVAYVRVSTDRQADNGNSLEAQQAKLEAYAVLFNLEIVAVEVDAGESAGTLDRPGLQRALARLDAFEATGLLVVKLDRLTRSVRDLCELVDTYFRDGQNRLLSVGEQIDTASAGGRLVINVLTAVSQWEREAAGERTAAVMQHMKAEGKFCGGWPPYGWREEDGVLIEVPEEQAMILRAKALRGQGHSLRAITCAMGTNPRTGKAFQLTQIARMM